MPRRRRFVSPAERELSSSSSSDLLRLWVLRALVPLGGSRSFLRHDVGGATLTQLIGLSDWLEAEECRVGEGNIKSAAIQAQLRTLHEAAESTAHQAKVPPVLEKNVQTLGAMLKLNAVERRLLEFSILVHAEPDLAEAVAYLGSMGSVSLRRALHVILNIDEAAVKQALSPTGTLHTSGIVQVDRTVSQEIPDKLDLLSSGFADAMLADDNDPESALRGAISRCSPALLSYADYPHLAQDLKILVPYLRHALAAHKPGVNVLIHGAPGTGKSQLARVIAQDLQCTLFEVSSEDREGDPIDAEHRLRAHRAGQGMLAHAATILLFDEVEDVFADGDSVFGRKSTAQLHKAWINRILEENPVPCLWLSNNVGCMDPAFLRRFDMVIELEVPPLAQRRRIAEQVAGDLLPARVLNTIAASEHLAPALISRAADVVRSIRDTLPETEVSAAVERLISTTLRVQGHPELSAARATCLPDYYDPAFINTNEDLQAIADGIAAQGSARICLYGPPGTGKTAFGHWLASRLQRPLQMKRASDILSMWLGGTEQNLARAFREATSEGALLLIDEVDSFLQDRGQARHSWEVSSVNEMLTQMEAFGGVFIASTNLVDGIDQAALRRFDLKLRFDYLRSDQAWLLLQRQCKDFGLPSPSEALRHAVAQLKLLTPGDFAVIARQHRFRPFTDAETLVKALQQECLMKHGGKRTPIGFVGT